MHPKNDFAQEPKDALSPTTRPVRLLSQVDSGWLHVNRFLKCHHYRLTLRMTILSSLRPLSQGDEELVEEGGSKNKVFVDWTFSFSIFWWNICECICKSKGGHIFTDICSMTWSICEDLWQKLLATRKRQNQIVDIVDINHWYLLTADKFD